MIYIQKHNPTDLIEFGEQFKKSQFTVRTKSDLDLTPTPMLLTFRDIEPQIYLDMQGKEANTKVYFYYETLITCKSAMISDIR